MLLTYILTAIVFQETHHFNAFEGGLAFIAIPVGGTAAVLMYVFVINKKYMRISRAMRPKPVPPEQRLVPLMLAAPLLVFCFFLFGW